MRRLLRAFTGQYAVAEVLARRQGNSVCRPAAYEHSVWCALALGHRSTRSLCRCSAHTDRVRICGIRARASAYLQLLMVTVTQRQGD